MGVTGWAGLLGAALGALSVAWEVTGKEEKKKEGK